MIYALVSFWSPVSPHTPQLIFTPTQAQTAGTYVSIGFSDDTLFQKLQLQFVAFIRACPGAKHYPQGALSVISVK